MLHILFACVSFLSTILVSIFNVNSASKIWIIPVCFVGVYLVCFLLFVLFIAVVSLPIKKDKEHNKFNKFYHNFFAYAIEYICNLSRVKLKCTGLEKLPKDKKFMLVVNHRSRFDPMIIYYKLKKYPIAFISKPSNFKIPFGGKFMAKNGFISIDRKNDREALKSILRAINNIKNDEYCIGVCPEGTRNMYSINLLDFRDGCFKIATRADVPIVITTIDGTEKIKKRAPWRSTKVTFDVVDVINPKDYENTAEISKCVREKMEKSLNDKN